MWYLQLTGGNQLYDLGLDEYMKEEWKRIDVGGRTRRTWKKEIKECFRFKDMNWRRRIEVAENQDEQTKICMAP